MDADGSLMQGGPGRNCPLHYAYGAASLRRTPDVCAKTVYVIGGLYGNPIALRRVLEIAASEPGEVRLIFNGDFNWFDIDAGDFEAINTEVLRHAALRGNVETELFAAAEDAGCGCGYPEWVDQADVDRSNHIMSRLRATAQGAPLLTKRLAALPMTMVAEVGGVRIGVVHGDADSLAGWGFSQETLPEREESIKQAFVRSGVDIFASSHTCLPVARVFGLHEGAGLLFNNGAAGMPNFAGTHFGLATRISTRPAPKALYGTVLRGVHVDAIAIDYDHRAWLSHFDRFWPAGSAAALSYRERIENGPDYRMEQAQRLRDYIPSGPAVLQSPTDLLHCICEEGIAAS